MVGVFKTYDIRGLYPDELSEEKAFFIGRTIQRILHPKRVVIGYDMRKSSRRYLHELTHALTSAEITVIGRTSSPLLYFSTIHGQYNLGIMLTASHNPAAYGGIKFMLPNGMPVAKGSGMELLERHYLEKKEQFPRRAKIQHCSYLKEYIARIRGAVQPGKQLKIVVDYGNGIMHAVAKHFWHHLPWVRVIELNEKPDGNFPHHIPNPVMPENMRELQAAVKKHKADLGIAFDGDGDRVGFVDEQGHIVPNDLACLVLVLNEFRTTRNAWTVYHDFRFSPVFEEVIKAAGGRAEKSHVGTLYYKKRLIREGGVLGCEYSGHIMYRDNDSIDDGLYAAAKMLHLLGESSKKCSQLIAPFDEYLPLAESNYPLHDLDRVIVALRKKFAGCHVDFFEGVSVRGKGFWFNLRKSNTEPVLRVSVLAKTRRQAAHIEKTLATIIKRA
ncbi:MAG: phosphomannomutase/phosphoglucomutase [archaeon]